MSSSTALLISLASAGVYGYAAYFMTFDTHLNKMHSLAMPTLRSYGHNKFLTYQCLLIQVLSAILHVGAHFVGSLKKPRDIVFTALAFPIGSIVVFSFWGVWLTVGRELIFPVALDAYYPEWLNHVTHTIIVPINLLTTVLVHHSYGRNTFAITALYFGLYTALLYYLKMTSGYFVYAYLETMAEPIRAIYFLSSGLIGYVMYKKGQLLDNIFHSKPSQRLATTKKSK